MKTQNSTRTKKQWKHASHNRSPVIFTAWQTMNRHLLFRTSDSFKSSEKKLTPLNLQDSPLWRHLHATDQFLDCTTTFNLGFPSTFSLILQSSMSFFLFEAWYRHVIASIIMTLSITLRSRNVELVNSLSVTPCFYWAAQIINGKYNSKGKNTWMAVYHG